MIQLLEKQKDNKNKILTPLETFWTLLLKSKMCQTYDCFTVVKLKIWKLQYHKQDLQTEQLYY